MSTRFLRRLPLLAGGLTAAGLALAPTSEAHPAAPCDARHGSTVLADSSVRVFRRSGLTYACARPAGAVRTISPPGPQPGEILDLKLAGRFVAWEQIVDESVAGSALDLYATDVRSSARRHLDGFSSSSSASPSLDFGDFVVSTGGVVAWIVNSTTCDTSCSVASTLFASHGRGKSVLETDTNVSQPSGPKPPAPISSLGLSASGHYVYWQTNGVFRGAALSP